MNIINNKALSRLIIDYKSFMNNSKYCESIYFKDIKYFDINISSSRNSNDLNNKKREQIICTIINKETPDIYFKKSSRWFNLKKELDNFISQIANKYSIKHIGYLNFKN